MCNSNQTQCINCNWKGHVLELGISRSHISDAYETYCPNCGLFDFLINDDELDQMNVDEPLPSLDEFLRLSCLG